MRYGRAILFGVLGAGAISVVSAILRAVGLPIGMEYLLGTMTGMAPGWAAFMVGLAIHLTVGGLFGILYAYLFERVWAHGGASTGVILAMIHAAFLGMMFGLTPQFHPQMPGLVAAPGPYFSNLGTVGVIAFFALHVIYGAIVGGGYGHVKAERLWAPAGHL